MSDDISKALEGAEILAFPAKAALSLVRAAASLRGSLHRPAMAGMRRATTAAMGSTGSFPRSMRNMR